MQGVPSALGGVLADYQTRALSKGDEEQVAAVDGNRFWSDGYKEELKRQMSEQRDALAEEIGGKLRSVITGKIDAINVMLSSLSTQVGSLGTSAGVLLAGAPTALVPDPMAPGASASSLASFKAQKSALESAVADCNTTLSAIDTLSQEAGLELLDSIPGVSNPLPGLLAPLRMSLAAVGTVLKSIPL